jgi:single-strand DNA-binding protein
VPSSTRTRPAETLGSVNEVRLVGRLAGDPVRRELPSGDVLVSFRLVVPRPRAGRGRPSGGGARSPTVDTIECAAWRKDVQRTLARSAAGDVLEVQGALRRRFWRSGGGPASRSEVEVGRLRRVPAEG